MTANQPNIWSDRNVFVTGSTGLLGSWIVEVLVRSGANVVSLIRDAVPSSRLVTTGVINRVNIVHGQMEDYSVLERTLNEYQVKSVFHLAAQTIVGIANQSPLSTFESNIRGTWNLLEACRRTKWVSEVVVASSDKAYGENDQLPYGEDTPLMGTHPYDVSKSCADLLAQTYASTYNLPVCVTRFGNLFGPGDINFNRLIPGTIRSIVRNEAPVIRSNGKPSRDYIYVEDAARAYILLAEKMAADPKLHGNAFNFSYGSPLSAKDAVDKILAQMERQDLEPVILNDAPNEIPHQYLDPQKAKQMLGWQPEFDFDRGLAKTISWYQNSLKGKDSA